MKSNEKPKTESRAQARRSEAKWTKPLMEAGFTIIPSIIFERQRALGLDAVDVNVLMQLFVRWWTADNPPYHSLKDIAYRMEVSVSTIQRSLRRMKDAGLIEIRPRFDDRGQTSNSYHFDGLIKEATPFAEEALADRAKRQQEEQDRSIRRRPRSALRVVEPKKP